jgi:MFS family permease
MTVAALVIRLIGGKASDRWGRQPVLQVCSFFVALSMLVIGFSESILQLSIGVALYGLAHGATSPTLIAWATDLSDHRFKGRGVASVYIFMEFGIGFGAFASGLIYANNPSRLITAFAICSAFAAVGFLYLMTKKEVSNIPS